MLTITAEIMFFSPDGKQSINEGIIASEILRPSFNFGEGLLFSGTIKPEGAFDKYLFQQKYNTKVDFPTIEKEAFDAIQPLLKPFMNLTIQNASKVIGEARMIDFIYKD